MVQLFLQMAVIGRKSYFDSSFYILRIYFDEGRVYHNYLNYYKSQWENHEIIEEKRNPFITYVIFYCVVW